MFAAEVRVVRAGRRPARRARGGRVGRRRPAAAAARRRGAAGATAAAPRLAGIARAAAARRWAPARRVALACAALAARRRRRRRRCSSPAGTTAPGPARQVVALDRFDDGPVGARGTATVALVDGVREVTIDTRGLKPSAPGTSYEVWMIRDAKTMVGLGHVQGRAGGPRDGDAPGRRQPRRLPGDGRLDRARRRPVGPLRRVGPALARHRGLTPRGVLSGACRSRPFCRPCSPLPARPATRPPRRPPSATPPARSPTTCAPT